MVSDPVHVSQRVSSSPLECTVELELVKRVLALGGVPLKLAPRFGRGFPDRLIIMPGGFLLVVEVKRPRGGRLSAHQKRWLERLRLLGVVVAVVRTTRDIDALLQPFKIEARDALNVTGLGRSGPPAARNGQASRDPSRA